MSAITQMILFCVFLLKKFINTILSARIRAGALCSCFAFYLHFGISAKPL